MSRSCRSPSRSEARRRPGIRLGGRGCVPGLGHRILHRLHPLADPLRRRGVRITDGVARRCQEWPGLGLDLVVVLRRNRPCDRSAAEEQSPTCHRHARGPFVRGVRSPGRDRRSIDRCPGQSHRSSRSCVREGEGIMSSFATLTGSSSCEPRSASPWGAMGRMLRCVVMVRRAVLDASPVSSSKSWRSPAIHRATRPPGPARPWRRRSGRAPVRYPWARHAPPSSPGTSHRRTLRRRSCR